jgi:hypothetical protein
MAQTTDPQKASTLLLDEYFEAGDERFLDELFACTAENKFKTLGRKLFFDERPFAQDMLRRYIDDGCDRPRHRLLVKRLFKFAEENQRHDLMARFLVVFDRLSKRTLVEKSIYDYRVRKVVKFKQLQSAQTNLPLRFDTRRQGKEALQFSRCTRLYLQRRAFRYFRRLASKDTARYGEVIRGALLLYRDEHLQKPEQLLDSWSLLHILYWGSPVLLRTPRGVRLADKRSLGELGPAPFCPSAWSGIFDTIFDLALRAESRTVRAFSLQLLQRDYNRELQTLSLANLKRLLLSSFGETQELGATLLRGSAHLAQLTIGDWVSLLRLESPSALALICEQAVKYVRAEELTLAQCVALATLRVAPVAELGLRWATEKRSANEDDLKLLLRLGNAEVETVRREALAFLLPELLASPHLASEHLRELIDSKYADVREAALDTMKNEPKLRDSLVLWAALAETPYDNVRNYLIKRLGETAPLYSADTLRSIWASSLLAIHRGGRSKRQVIKQLSERVISAPQEAADLVPLLGVALRSVRSIERRSALASLTVAALRAPVLRGLLAEKLPELRISEEAA